MRHRFIVAVVLAPSARAQDALITYKDRWSAE
jgi:hypothetical protein